MGRAKALVQALMRLLPITGHHPLLGHTLPRSGRLPREVRDQVAYLPQSCCSMAASRCRSVNLYGSVAARVAIAARLFRLLWSVCK